MNVVSKEEFVARLIAVRAMCSSHGWMDIGEGEPLAETCAWQATLLASALVDHGMDWPYLYPTTSGGISLEWSTLAWDVSVEVYPTGDAFGGATMVRGGQRHALNTVDFETTIDRALPETLAMLRAAGLLRGGDV